MLPRLRVPHTGHTWLSSSVSDCLHKRTSRLANIPKKVAAPDALDQNVDPLAAGKEKLAMTSYILSKLPSRNWCIFWGASASITGLGLYDMYRFREIRKDLVERAAILALEPLPTTEMPRKVIVYVAPSHWARYWFREYVKPDYDLVEPKKVGGVRTQVRDLIWTGKDEAKQPAAPSAVFENPYVATAPPKYLPENGLVAVGPGAWREMLRGLREGCLAERPPPPPAEDPLPTPTPSIDGETLNPDVPTPTPTPAPTPASTPLDLSDTNIPQIPLPPVGYITGRNMVGWSKFPARIYAWFHERDTIAEVGEEALQIAFGRTREFRDSDANRGADDYYHVADLEQEQEDAVAPVALEYGVREKLWIYN
ncbi:inner membrane protein import complex subunit Tim54-domain-containing protein [Blyttiomyces helicus]|uniref:Mitochondrial import inner membrane translocase subunit TIM54 n=1 Tax=Blyttiomyces helicus TaxID=388810 RepID=A0A4P9WH91_9FUNG|nr:inner membrane protein import complex subunit Tim54-domain-containing protein [Blyttiomyces helicus]|eukprot:RKO91213.1 inner membrane protein import complex subunit Tim54-domain-containing protein [Blyttiomyces helicus]